MSFFIREQRYEMLCAIKRGHSNPNLPKRPLTDEEEAFVIEFATDKFHEMMEDPEVVAVMRRLKYR